MHLVSGVSVIVVFLKSGIRASVEGVWYPNIPILKKTSANRYPNTPVSQFYRLIFQYPTFSGQYPSIFSDITISQFCLPGLSESAIYIYFFILLHYRLTYVWWPFMVSIFLMTVLSFKNDLANMQETVSFTMIAMPTSSSPSLRRTFLIDHAPHINNQLQVGHSYH